MEHLNITDRFQVACSLINYFRNVLRFMSAYICCMFTIRRLSVVSKPLLERSKSNSDAWRTVFLLLAVSMLINVWVPFLFEIQQNSLTRTAQICDIKNEWKKRKILDVLIKASQTCTCTDPMK